MDSPQDLSPNATDLIDWMNGEELLELDWDFPEDGDLYDAGMDGNIIIELTAAIEGEYGVEVTPEEFKKNNVKNPNQLAELIASKLK